MASRKPPIQSSSPSATARQSRVKQPRVKRSHVPHADVTGSDATRSSRSRSAKQPTKRSIEHSAKRSTTVAATSTTRGTSAVSQHGKRKGRWLRLPEPPPVKMSYHRERWSERHVAILHEYYTTHGAIYTAALLGRTPPAIRARAQMYRLPGYETNTWDEQELRTAQRLFRKFGPHPGTITKIAKALGRTKGSISGQLKRYGMKVSEPRAWTVRETRILQRYYRTESAEQIGTRIDRSAEAVMLRAAALGVRKRFFPRPWTPKEEKRLLAMRRDGSTPQQMADALNRTKRDVVLHARSLEPFRNQRRWSTQEERLLRKLQPTTPYPEIARRLGRPVGSVRARIHDLGLGKENTAQPWTKRDDNRLRKLHGTMSNVEIGKLLDRTAVAVNVRAAKLGLTRTPAPRWSAEDVALLVRLHRAGNSYEEIAAQLGRTVVSVQVRANRMRLNARPDAAQRKRIGSS